MPLEPPSSSPAAMSLVFRLSALWALALLGACASWLPAPTPMRSVEWTKPAAKCLVVFLPGLGDDAEDFERHGFVAEIQRRGLSVDLIAAQATIGYYARGRFLSRLETDVIAPARARGYEQLWLIGNSMGGFGTLFYSRAHLEHVTGILALAPYLGDRDLVAEIRKQGGLAQWRAPARVDVMTEDNYQRELWRWLAAATAGREPAPALYLAYGSDDRLAPDNRVLARALPRDHLFVIEGEHEWGTWKALFRLFLDRSPFAAGCR